MSEPRHIDIGRDFSRTLGPRYRSLGAYSGEEFRETVLRPVFEDVHNDPVIVSLDTILGFSPSFFEEAFGGLVREMSLPAVEKRLRLRAVRRAYLIPLIQAWMAQAEKERALNLEAAG